MFLAAIWSSLCSWSSMYRFISPLIVVLVPKDLKLTHYALDCVACCLCHCSAGSGKTRVSILHVDLISCQYFLKYSVCLNLLAQLVPDKWECLRLAIDFLWCVPSRRIENPWFLLAITASQWRNVLFDPCFIEAWTRVLCFFDGIFLDFWCTRWLIYSITLPRRPRHPRNFLPSSE